MKMPIPYVFIPKYRKKVLYEKIREDIREILVYISILYKYKNTRLNVLLTISFKD